MDISRVILDTESQALINTVSDRMSECQQGLDDLSGEYQAALEAVNAVKAKIIPLKRRLSPLSELQASIASRKSRAKYFPQFATRNFDSSRDAEFLEFVNSRLIPDKD